MALNRRGGEPAATGSAPAIIGRYGLFEGQQDEAAYLRDNWHVIAQRLRLGGLWGGLGFMAASAIDWQIVTSASTRALLLGLRLVVFAMGLSLMRCARADRTRDLACARRAMVLMQVGILSAYQLIMLAYGRHTPDHLIASLLICLLFYAYAPLLSPLNLWLQPVALGTSLLQIHWIVRAPAHSVILELVLEGSANVIGWQAAVQTARAQRLAWLDRMRLQREFNERTAAEQNLEHVFEVCPVPLVLTTEHTGIVLRVNRAALDLLDPQQRLRTPGQPLTVDFYAAAATRRDIVRALAANGIMGPTDVRLRTSGGELIEVMLAARPLVYNNESCILTSLVEITKRKLHERELQRLAQSDPLTGLHNRRGLFMHAAALLKQPDARPLSLLLIDVDHFKSVNDAHGHDVGDATLQEVAARMTEVMRANDILARIGGEEFAALLPGAGLDAALSLAERLRRAVSASNMVCDGHDMHVTVSVGVAELDSTETSIEAALARADRAMYSAKRSGRNRVEFRQAARP